MRNEGEWRDDPGADSFAEHFQSAWQRHQDQRQSEQTHRRMIEEHLPPAVAAEVTKAHEQLADFTTRADELQHDLSIADVATGDRIRKLPEDQQWQYTQATADIDPNLPDRYDSAQYLMSAVSAILRDNRNGASLLDDNPSYLAEKIGAALAPFGLRVERVKEPTHRQQVRKLTRLKAQYGKTNGDTLPPASKK